MKRLLRGLCALLLMTLLLPTALAAKATPTPPPVAISTEAPVQPPEQIQQVLDIAYNEWAELDGKTLKNVNKYTEWRGKGIGFGLAKAFAKEGANLTITGRTMSRLEAAREKLEAEYGVKVLPITADGADEASVANVVKQTVETFGHIDTVVNNAQVSKSRDAQRSYQGRF